MIYFTIYHPDKLITMLNLYYNELIGKIDDYGGKPYLMVDDYTLDKVLDKIKRTGIEELDNTKILIDIDDITSDDITLKNAVILMTYQIIRDLYKFYSHFF